MPMSERQRRWNNGNFSAYGYGWRLSDVDGVLRVAHTGTLGGMYSALTLLPEKRSGFVFMINGEGSRARTVLNEALVKQFTAPGRAAAGRLVHRATESGGPGFRIGRPRAPEAADAQARDARLP